MKRADRQGRRWGDGGRWGLSGSGGKERERWGKGGRLRRMTKREQGGDKKGERRPDQRC